MRGRRLALVVAALAVLAVVASVIAARESDGEAQERRPARATPAPAPAPPATPADHLRALADAARASGGTRAAGTPGDARTRAYVTAQLRAAGWRVREERVGFPFFDEQRPPRLRLDGRPSLRPRAEIRTLEYSGSATVRGTIRSSGDGCAAAAFRGLRRGDVALVSRGPCRLRVKARNAEAAGAAALLVVNAAPRTFPGTLAAPGVGIPVLGLSVDAGRRAAAAQRAEVSVDATSERRTTANVIAEAGSGDRVVMAGAHLDSVPEGPGMNDNASGVAATLAVARALGRTPPAGARVRLGFWGAEELGLYGSRRYVRALDEAERRALVAYLNLDMVGTPEGRVRVYATDAGVRLALRRGLQRQGHRRIGSDSLDNGSDHAAFVAAGVAAGGIFTGLDACYHERCDDAGNVDAGLVGDVAAATADALRALAG